MLVTTLIMFLFKVCFLGYSHKFRNIFQEGSLTHFKDGPEEKNETWNSKRNKSDAFQNKGLESPSKSCCKKINSQRTDRRNYNFQDSRILESSLKEFLKIFGKNWRELNLTAFKICKNQKFSKAELNKKPRLQNCED